MAWTPLSSSPGPLRTGYYIDKSATTWLQTTMERASLYAVQGHATFYDGIKTNSLGSNGPLRFPDKYNTGWINYSEGGGGSSRPSSGMLYPRFS